MADEGEKGEGKGFKVADRRRFSPETGEPREGTAPAEAPAGTAEPGAGDIGGAAHSRSQDESDAQLPEINFSTFVISLSTQALRFRRDRDPTSGKVEANFPWPNDDRYHRRAQG